MGRAVIGRQTGAVHTENHRQILQSHIMDDAVISALQEGRVNRHHRPVIHGRHAGGKDHRVFLGDAHIEITSGQLIPQRLQARTTRHGRRHAHHFGVAFAELHHLFAKHILPVRRGAGLSRRRLASLRIVGPKP